MESQKLSLQCKVEELESCNVSRSDFRSATSDSLKNLNQDYQTHTQITDMMNEIEQLKKDKMDALVESQKDYDKIQEL